MTTSMRKVLGFGVLLVCGVLATGSAAFGEEIKIAGGAGPVENVLKPVKEAFEKATGIKLIITSSGATIAFKEFVKGNLDASSAGYTYEELLQDEKKEGFVIPDPSAYKGFEVAKGQIVMVVHKDNPVTKLDKEQLAGIFSGKIQNWKDVGGKDAPILIVLSKLSPATNSTVKKAILDGKEFSKDVADTTTIDELKQFVAVNSESIGFGPATIVGGGVKTVESPGVYRVISIITKAATQPKVQKLIDFINGEGQKLIKK